MTVNSPATGISPAPAAADYPLSSAQLAMWATTQTTGQRSAYVVPLHYWITAAVDPERLRAALALVHDRHESLRTAFVEGPTGVRQRIVNDAKLDWATATVAGEDQDATIAAFFARDFDLAEGDLLHALLISTEQEDHHHLLLSAHHIALDAWSARVLVEELQRNYTALRSGGDGIQPALPIQYRDYATWQQQLLVGPLDDARHYWREHFAQLPEPLDLPSDRPRPAQRGFAGATLRQSVAPELAKALADYCRAARVSLFVPLMAVTRILLHRYAGQRDIVLGVPSMDRPFAVLYDQIGCYLNTVALRVTLEESISFRRLVNAVNVTLRDGMRNVEVPFNLVVLDAGVPFDRSRNPLFDVMVSYLPDAGEPEAGAALAIRDVPTENGHSKLDLTILFEERDGLLEIAIEYSTALFDAERISAMIDHLQVLMANAIATPDVPVESLGMMTAAETDLVVSRFNDTERSYDLDRTVVARFEAQARSVPDAIATTDGLTFLTYAEFEERTRTLASVLVRDHEVHAGDLVAIWIPRSIDLVIAIWGVLRAGAAYLPLNLADRAERIADVLADSGARTVLAAGTDRVFNHAAVDVRVVAQPLATTVPALPDRPSPEDAAYCIYTSGSTGVPKGIRIRHRSLVNRLEWMREELNLTPQDVVLQKTTASFDVSVWELVLPFTIGATQVLLPQGDEADPEKIDAAIRRHGITLLHFVPSMLSAYLDAVPSGLHAVRACICSGEALDRTLADRFFAAHDSTELWNYYGPTEATIDVTSTRVPRSGPVTIGRPAANNRLFVLDSRDQPLPPGVPGNLCLAGVQVGDGYLNRPDLTAEKFVRLPDLTEGPVYRTGDLAAWTRDGELRFLGRNDHQVKIRGYRVELGDIESVLAEYPGVERAVVLPMGEHGNTALLAFVAGTGADESSLRALSRLRLPAYMIPARFVSVPTIPVTRNGKIDRAALLAAATARAESSVQLAATVHEEHAPRGHWETELQAIWSALLPPGTIGRTDDFFEIGGHSLLILRLRGQILERFAIDLDTASLFRSSTIAEQAAMLESAGRTTRERFTAGAGTRESPLSHDQERMWFLHMLDPKSTAYNIRTLADIRGTVDFVILEESFLRLQQRQEILRVTYGVRDGRPYQEAHDVLPLRFEHLDFRSMDPEDADTAADRRIAAEELQAFALSEEAPLRATLMTIADGKHRLLITLHHIAGDGWSMRLLTQELATLYGALIGTEEPGLSELPIQYRDYATAVRGPAYEAAVAGHLSWWQHQLADAPRLALPTDSVPAIAPGTAGTRIPGVLDHDWTQRLRELRRGTDFEVAMAALMLLLSRLCGQKDISVGFPVANRTEVALERLVGLFLNTLVLRIDVTEAATFTQLVTTVREQLREAYAHQPAPFGAVVERLNPERDIDRPPIFDVLLNDVGDLQADSQIEGLDIRFGDEVFEPEAKVPLAFYLSRRSGDDGEVLHIELMQRPDLGTPDRGRILVAQYLGLLRQVIDDPERPLDDYSLVVADAPNPAANLDKAIEAPLLPTIVDLIVEQAHAHPDAPAVAVGEQHLSYRDLVKGAQRIAKHLRAIGIREGSVVAVTGERSPGFFVALLGVFASGAVLLPLDPALPAARTDRLLSIGQPSACLRTDATVDPLTDVPDILVDAGQGFIVDASSTADDADVVLPALDRDGAAYLFFTSGTTGTPRGVLGRHQSLSHFLLWEREEARVTASDRVAQLTSLSFDVMLRDSLIALVCGGTTVLPTEADAVGGSAVLRWLTRERITVLHTVPTVLRSWLLDAPDEPLLGSLRTVLFAGEPLPGELVDRLRAMVPGACEVFNLYGPTETTLAKMFHRVTATPAPFGVQQIGRPLPQCDAFVLAGDRVCGVGELGEIVLRTPFRSLGYSRDPAATSAVFLINQATALPDDLLYRTGDLGRVRPDGGIDIVGRGDHQVKINGVRIQPSEIEQTLLLHPLVDAAVVLPYESGEDKLLIAYVVATMTSGASGNDFAGELRRFLREQLPAAMVPAEVLLVPTIPVTANGKLDRGGLPMPQLASASERPSRAASTSAETTIMEFWQRVLERPVPGIDVDFFAFGGNSMKLLRLFALLDEHFPQQIRVAQLFSHSTIQQQAGIVAPEPPADREETVQDYDF